MFRGGMTVFEARAFKLIGNRAWREGTGWALRHIGRSC